MAGRHPLLERRQLTLTAREGEPRQQRERSLVRRPPNVHAQPVLHMPQELFPTHGRIVSDAGRFGVNAGTSHSWMSPELVLWQLAWTLR